MQKSFEKEYEIIEHALNAFQRTTGLQGYLTQAGQVSDQRLEGVIEILIKDTESLRFAVQVKHVDRFQVLNTLKIQEKKSLYPCVLIAPYISQEMAEYCRDLEISFMDEAGNAYLTAPGLFIYVTGKGRPPEVKTSRLFRSLNPAGLRIIFALLQHPELADAPYRVIAHAAGVALGTVGEVLTDLEQRGYMTSGDVKPRRLLFAERLQEEWVIHYPIKLRPKLYPMRHPPRFSAPDLQWWQNLDVRKYHGWWGGEVAAAKLTDYLIPASQTVYLPKAPLPFLSLFIFENHLRPDKDGAIEILEVFWDDQQLIQDNLPSDTVPPLLIYADLMASTDSRNIETAKIIREHYL